MTAAEIADAAPLAVFLVAAAIALTRRNARPTGVLVAIVALTWVLGTWVPPLLWAHRAALIYLVFAFPGLVPRPRAFIAVAGVLSVASALPVLVLDERASVAIGAAVFVGALCAVRCCTATATQADRRGDRCGGTSRDGAHRTDRSALSGLDRTTPLVVYLTCIAMVVLVLVIYAMTATPHASTVTGLIGDLSDVMDTGTLRVRLARALGDPSLRIGYLDGSGSCSSMRTVGRF